MSGDARAVVRLAGKVRSPSQTMTTRVLPRVPVETLLAGGREAVLLHGGTEYRLRLTSNGKLILTK